jgi:hypothetical protein
MMAETVRKLKEVLREWQEYGSGIYESYHDETLWDIVDSDPEGVAALLAVFDGLSEADGQKLYLGGLILQKVPYLPAYDYLTQTKGVPPESYDYPLFEGVALLKKQGKIII